MVRIITFETAFIFFLPLRDSLELMRSSAASVSGSTPFHVSKLSSTGHLRTLLPVQDVLEHLQEEHGKGNRYPKFTLEIRDSRGEGIAVEVVESQSAILPTATFSVHGRPGREVGHLGYLNLVSADEASGDFVLLTVNPVDGEVRGVVKRLEEDWVIVNGEDELDSSGMERNLELFEDAGHDLFEEVSGEKVEILRVIEKRPRTFYASRQLQAFHSNYLYQVDLFLDIDYEFVKNNGGTLCNVFSYVNSLVTAANAVLEREIMSHVNVVSIRQTDFYDDVDSATDALGKMSKMFGGPEWHEDGVDLHYALLGKTLKGGLGERAGIAFIENSLCDPATGFGVVSGLKGGFSTLDERLGSDLTRFMYAIGHSFGSGPVSGELESLLFTYGGYWSQLNSINDIDSWLDNPNLNTRENPRRVSYKMFMSANDQSCLDVPSRSYIEDDSVIGECLSGMSFSSLYGSALSFESMKHYPSNAIVKAQDSPTSSPTLSPSYIPTFAPTLAPTLAPTFAPTVSPTRSKSSKQTKGTKVGKNGGKGRKSGKTTKVIASDRGVDDIDDVEVAPSKLSVSSAVVASPTYFPSYVPTFIPTFVPTVSPTRSKSSKQTKGTDGSKGGKNSDKGNGSGKKTKVLASDRGVKDKDDVEVAPSKLSGSSAVTASPTYFPSYLPTFAPTFIPTASPTRSKSSKQSKRTGGSKGGKNSDKGNGSGKTKKLMASDRGVNNKDDVEVASSKLSVSSAVVASPTYFPSYVPTFIPTSVPTTSPTRSKSSKQTKGTGGSKGGKNGDESNGSGKTTKVMASDRGVNNKDDVEVAPSKLSVSSAVVASPTYFPSYVPTFIPTFVPTISPTRSKSSKQSKGTGGSIGGKNGDEGNGSGKTTKVMASDRVVNNKDDVEVAPSKLSVSSAVAASPTYFPSYVPTFAPTFVPTASPTGSKSSKQSKGTEGSKGGNNGDEGSKSGKRTKVMASDRGVHNKYDVEVDPWKLTFSSAVVASPTYSPSYVLDRI